MMTKKELLEKRSDVMTAHNEILSKLTDPWEIAHHNALLVYNLNGLIDKYLMVRGAGD